MRPPSIVSTNLMLTHRLSKSAIPQELYKHVNQSLPVHSSAPCSKTPVQCLSIEILSWPLSARQHFLIVSRKLELGYPRAEKGKTDYSHGCRNTLSLPTFPPFLDPTTNQIQGNTMALVSSEDDRVDMIGLVAFNAESNRCAATAMNERTLSMLEGFDFGIDESEDDDDKDLEEGDITYITVLPDTTTQSTLTDIPTPKPSIKVTPPPSSQITILCNHSPAPLTLPTHLLTTYSRLFNTLSHDLSTTTTTTSSPLHLNIDHEAFTVFARWLRGGNIHVPEGDENGFATDLYLLMRAHAAGEALGADTFADMVMDEIIGELTRDEVEEDGGSVRSGRVDSRAKARDLEILLQAAAAIWPAGSLGRDLLVDWYVHSPAWQLQNLSAEAVVEIGDLDLAARCMVLGKERQMACELGEIFEAPYLMDPCRYHEHRRVGKPCYKRSRDSVFSQLELVVRCGVGVLEDEDDDDSGFEGDMVSLWEYEACVEESLRLLEGD